MADIKNKERTIELRKKGKSLTEISNKLSKPKSTIAFWCRNITLSKAQEENLRNKSKNAGIQSFINNAKRKHLKHVKLLTKNQTIGKQRITQFTKRDLDMLCIGLYWGEGYKYDGGEFGFTNSNPEMIQVYLEWLKSVHHIDISKITLRISINHIHSHREKEVLDFWHKVTNISKDQFTKMSLIKSQSKKVYSNHKDHYGTLRVKVRGGAPIRAQILGSIEEISKKYQN